METRFRLIVPNSIAALPVVSAFVASSAKLAGFDGKELTTFELIAEESFIYTLRTSFEKGEKAEIEIITTITDIKFFVSLIERGLPFGYKEAKSDDLSNISLNIIKSKCKKVEWINHGKQGTEMRIHFSRPGSKAKDITQYDFIQTQEQHKPSNNIQIELLKPGYAYQVSQIIYRSYGYTYPNEDMYYPEIIENLNKQGRLISIVAVDKAYDKIIGHYAIERYNKGDVAELGQAVVDPDYRGMGLLIKMREKVEETAKKLNIKGLYSQPVASHTRTQRVNENFGSRVCGISFGLVPREFNYKKMEKIKPLNERETCFLYFKPLTRTARSVYIPQKHGKIIRDIYSWLGIELKTPEDTIRCDKKSTIDAKYNASWGFATINVLSVGEDLIKRVRTSLSQIQLSTDAEIIFLNIPLSDCPLDPYIEGIENLGFFFCGILPYAIEGKDIIRFQHLNTMIDTSRIKAYSSQAQTILDYSANQMRTMLAIQ